jgi:hypothetical protein
MKRAFVLGLCVVVCVAPAARGEKPDARATVAFLARLQNKDGGFRPSPMDEKSSLRATSSAIRAIKYLGGDLPNRAECVKFVESCFDKASGGFADAPGGKPEVAVTAVGLMAVVELKMDAEKYTGPAIKYLDENAKNFDDVRIAVAGFEAIGKKAPQAEKWAEMVQKMAGPDGLFGKEEGQARDTGGAVVVLLRLGAKVEKPEVVLKALNGGQRADGGFGKAGEKGSDLESTYRVLRAYHMLKAKPADVARLRQFIDSCRNADGGYGVAPGKPSSASGTYFAAIVLTWLAPMSPR